MTTATQTLAEFILARVADDEAAVRADLVGREFPNPARVLAQCKVYREIVALSWHHFGEDDYAWGMEEAKRQVLAYLAAIWADHEDWREEWRP